MKWRERIARLEENTGQIEPRCIAVLALDATRAAADFIGIGLSWTQGSTHYRTALLQGETFQQAAERIRAASPVGVFILAAVYEHQREQERWRDAINWPY